MRRPEPSAAARTSRIWPLLVVVLGVLVGLVVAVLSSDGWRLGCVVMGASLLIGATERLVLPRNGAGLLQVRSKPFDVTVLLAAGVAVVTLALAIPPGR